MKITLVQGAFLPVPPLLGGAVEKVWHVLGREFAARGHEVVHISRSFASLPDEETDAGVRHRRVRGHDTPRALWRLKLLDLAYSLRVRRILPAADVVVTNTFWLPVLLAGKSAAGHPYIHIARYPRGQLRFYPRHATYQTVSTPIRDAILDELSPRRRRVAVIPYPIPSPSSESTPRPDQESKILLYAGRIHPEKGLDLLIEAFRRFHTRPEGREWRLNLVGPWESAQGGGGADYKQRLEQLAHGLPVTLPGPDFSAGGLARTYREATLFVYPSLAEKGETFGLAVLEAMSAGTAPVVSNLACFRDFVRPDENGLIFDHHATDPAEALATALRRAAGDRDLRTALGRAARATSADYSTANVASLYLNDFEQIIRP